MSEVGSRHGTRITFCVNQGHSGLALHRQKLTFPKVSKLSTLVSLEQKWIISCSGCPLVWLWQLNKLCLYRLEDTVSEGVAPQCGGWTEIRRSGLWKICVVHHQLCPLLPVSHTVRLLLPRKLNIWLFLPLIDRIGERSRKWGSREKVGWHAGPGLTALPLNWSDMKNNTKIYRWLSVDAAGFIVRLTLILRWTT